MKQKLGVVIIWLCFTTAIFAQQNKTIKEDNSSFVFTESQLNEGDDAMQSATAQFTSNNDVYLSNVGYLFSPMRFRVRGLDSQYNDMYINGVRFNDVETGRFSYGLLGGLNDATRNKEGIAPFEENRFAYSPIGGATNLNLRASQYAAGSKLSISGSNRNYILRAMYTYSTGLLKNGWAFTGSLSYRWGKDGQVEGIYYNSLGYFLTAEKVFNAKHSLTVSTWGTPTERSQQTASTEEAYYLANSHYYNPNWGYQAGEKRNARVVRSFEPSAILTWDYAIDKTNKLTTSAGFKYSNYGTSALGWNGNAADPRPDYYKKFPSAAFNVYNGEEPNEGEFAQFNEVTDFWKSHKANRQINWDQMYFANSQANVLGKQLLYYLEERHNDQLAFNLSSTYSHEFNKNHSITGGILANTTKGMHYKKMKDMLGGENYIDIDKFSVRDYGVNSSLIQNDLNNPNRIIKEGDTFGYNYNVFVYKESAWAQYIGRSNHFDWTISGKIGSTQMERDGLMKNGRAANKSYGKSGVAKFLEGGGKIGLTYKINGKHFISLNGSYEDRAPLSYNAFIAPRIKNDFVNGLQTEKIYTGEFNYNFNTSIVNGRISAYYTRMRNQVEMEAFYNDTESKFTYLSMNGVDKEHWGVEAAATFKLLSNLSLTAIGTWSDARYMNNPSAVKTYESEYESNNDKVYAKGLRVNGTPLSAYSLTLDYNTKGWFFSLSGNYYHRVYLDFSSYRRLESVLPRYKPNAQGKYDYTVADLDSEGGLFLNSDGKIITAHSPKQEELDGGFTLDASIGKYIRLKNGKSLSINLSLNNILNNTNLRTGGYEQNRSDKYEDGTERIYVFSKNSKYYYAPPFNAFLNFGYRF